MAIERAFIAKQKDLQQRAARSGSEFSELIASGKSEEAQQKLQEAKVLFEQSEEIETLRSEVAARLSHLGGDVPFEILNEVFQAPREKEEVVKIFDDLPPTPIETIVEKQPSSQIVNDQPKPQEAKSKQESLRRPKIKEVKQKKEKMNKNDFSEKQDEIARALVRINAEKSDFQFSGLADITQYLDREELSKITDPNERKKRELSLRALNTYHRDKAVQRLQLSMNSQSANTPIINTFLKFLGEQPEFSGLDQTGIIQVLQRKKTFKELGGTSNSSETSTTNNIVRDRKPGELNAREIYNIARALNSTDSEILSKLGIKLEDPDKLQIRKITEHFEATHSNRNKAESTNLVSKLRKFVEDKQSLFLANDENEDAQFILSLLSPMDDAENVHLMLEAINKSKRP